MPRPESPPSATPEYGPNWFTAVMGTGVIAVAVAGLPFPIPGGHGVAVTFWLAAAGLLVAVYVAAVRRWHADRTIWTRHLDDPVLAHFYGAPPMAVLTVGAATMVAGPGVIGSDAATGVGAACWIIGTVAGLVSAVAVPYRMITAHTVGDDAATGGWLVSVVPPMVSATTGAALVGHLPAGQPRETMLLACYALFGLTALSGLLILNQVWQRIIRHGLPGAPAVPTLWIGLGFLGQSITAAHHLGRVAPEVAGEYGHALSMFALCYGVPLWGFTMFWLALVAALTVRQLRDGLPFAPTWWSFTFPVGTVVTGTSALAEATGLVAFGVAAGALLAVLIVGWLAAVVASIALFANATGSAVSPESTAPQALSATS